MRRFWRLSPEEHAQTPGEAFSGEGARLHGNRWNSKGVAVAYAAESLALAALEILVHVPWRAAARRRWVICLAECPDEVAPESLGAPELPPGWDVSPAPPTAAAVGDAWARQARSPVLLLPSAVVRRERIALLNPAHPEFSRLSLQLLEPFTFDVRLAPPPRAAS